MISRFASSLVTRRLGTYRRNGSSSIAYFCNLASTQSSPLQHIFSSTCGQHKTQAPKFRNSACSIQNALPITARDSHRFSLHSSLNLTIRLNSNIAQETSPNRYNVLRVSGYGTMKMHSLSIKDLLERHSGFHVRDLFALKLTIKKNKKSNSYIKYMSRPRPVILPRGDEIIIAFGYIRAVIGRESAILFDADDPNVMFLARELVELFESKPFSYKDPFELVFMEEILRDTCNTFDLRLKLYEPIVDSSLSEVSVTGDSEASRLVPLKDSLQEFEIKVKQSLKCLTDMLGNEEDLLSLSLTEAAKAKQNGEKLDAREHVKMELLFEEYARQLDNILHEIQYLMKRIESKREMIGLSMDSFRNRWLRVNVYLSIVGISLATSTTVAGFFGMNMINGLDESPTAFLTVSMATCSGSLVLFLFCFAYVRGTMMKRAAKKKIKDVELIQSALADMTAVDYAAKITLKSREALDEGSFKDLITSLSTKDVSDDEIKLLFTALDTTKDGKIRFDDFRPYDYDTTGTKLIEEK